MGLRYTLKETEEIQALAKQGYTNQQIADKLGRTQAAIRNIRHRNKIKTQTRQDINTLRSQRTRLNQEVKTLQAQTVKLETRHRQVTKALQTNEATLNNRLETRLRQLKYQKPELFKISTEDQIAKLTGELATHLIKWLIN